MTSIDLWEVITTDAAGRAYGMTFHDDSTARAYARTMRREGYDADASPVFGTEASLTAALSSAASFYEDAALHQVVRNRKEQGL